MNVSPSIGIAIIGSLLGSNALAGGSITGATGTAANYANLLLVAAGTALLGPDRVLRLQEEDLRRQPCAGNRGIGKVIAHYILNIIKMGICDNCDY